MSKELTYSEFERRERSHGFDLITTREEWAAARSKHITARSPNGHDQIRRIDIFPLGAIEATCHCDQLERKGETTCVLVVSALLGTTPLRVSTPHALKWPGYWLDGWTQLRGPDDRQNLEQSAPGRSHDGLPT